MNIFLIIISFAPLLLIWSALSFSGLLAFAHDQSVWSSLGATLLQSFLSACAICILSLIAAPGYAGFPKFKKILQSFLLFPQIVSPIFVVLALLIAMPAYPYGLWGVVFGHIFINLGLGIIVLGEKWESIESEWQTLSRYWGVSRFMFIKNVVVPLLWPQILFLFAIVFGFSMNSLVIPLTLGGGGKSYSIEAMIFEKIKAEADISSAMYLSLLQFLLQGLVFFIFIKYLKLNKSKNKTGSLNEPHGSTWVVTFFISLILIYPVFKILWWGLNSLSLPTYDYISLFLVAIKNSIFISIVTSLLTTGVVFLWSVGNQKKWVTKIPALSSAVVGLSVIVLLSKTRLHSSFLNLMLIAVAQVCVTTLIILRLISEPLNEIHQRFNAVILVYNIPWKNQLSRVYWPLGKKYFLLALAISFCWSLGEFSIASLVSPSGGTLSVFIYQLMGQYRMEQAALFSFVFLLLGFTVSKLTQDVFYGKT